MTIISMNMQKGSYKSKNGKYMNGVIEPMVNVKPVQVGKNVRMSFARIGEVLDMPNLIEVQKNSYNWFLNEGLKEVFRDVSGITDLLGIWYLILLTTNWIPINQIIVLQSVRSATLPMLLRSALPLDS